MVVVVWQVAKVNYSQNLATCHPNIGKHRQTEYCLNHKIFAVIRRHCHKTKPCITNRPRSHHWKNDSWHINQPLFTFTIYNFVNYFQTSEFSLNSTFSWIDKANSAKLSLCHATQQVEPTVNQEQLKSTKLKHHNWGQTQERKRRTTWQDFFCRWCDQSKLEMHCQTTDMMFLTRVDKLTFGSVHLCTVHLCTAIILR